MNLAIATDHKGGHRVVDPMLLTFAAFLAPLRHMLGAGTRAGSLCTLNYFSKKNYEKTPTRKNFMSKWLNWEPKHMKKDKIESCPCHTFPKGEPWDEARWQKHWADLRKGHQKRLEQLHLESRGIRRR